MESGSRQLQNGLNQGAAKLRLAVWIEARTGLPLTGASGTERDAVVPNLKPRVGRSAGQRGSSPSSTPTPAPARPASPRRGSGERPRDVMLHELTRAADGAGQLAVGAVQARHEVSSILEDPVGRRALDRLLITPETVREHPELLRSFAAYITPDGRCARIDLTQADRIYSVAAMDQVETIRRRTNEFLGEVKGLRRDGPDRAERTPSRLTSGP